MGIVKDFVLMEMVEASDVELSLKPGWSLDTMDRGP